MEFSVFTAILLAFWLSTADWCAIDARETYGRRKGLITWLALVAAPLGAALWFLPWQTTAMAAILATALSWLTARQARKHYSAFQGINPFYKVFWSIKASVTR